MSVGPDMRTQAQDTFADGSEIHGTAQFGPSGVRFNGPAYVGRPDSIVIAVSDAREAGLLLSKIKLAATIASGPHAGKAPPPYAVNEATGFFEVSVEQCRLPFGAVVKDRYFVDLGDAYFRGGDVVKYFWWAKDELGGFSSLPAGLATEFPASVETAELATGGLFEVNFLPTITWDAGYLAAVEADPHGVATPTVQQIINSPQRTKILYVNRSNPARRSAQRTAFMYTLDRLGYHEDYDVYDMNGLGNAENELMSRAQNASLNGFSLIIHDAGRTNWGAALTDGSENSASRFAQDTQYDSWLTHVAGTPPSCNTLWLIGEHLVQAGQAPGGLIQAQMRVASAAERTPLTSSFEVTPATSFRLLTARPDGSPYSISSELPAFRLHGGSCPDPRGQRTLIPNTTVPSSWAIESYAAGTFETVGPPVMLVTNHLLIADTSRRKNCIFTPFAWADFVSAGSEVDVASAILYPLLLPSSTPTDVAEDESFAERLVTHLYQNSPNPCNPNTVIAFDLAAPSVVKLQVLDVRGRLVRTLHSGPLHTGSRSVTWDGKDNEGHELASGIYLYYLETGETRQTRKMVLVR